MRPSSFLKIGVAVVVVALVAGAAVALWPTTKTRSMTAYFTNAVGMYPGAAVKILGIKVGQVDSVTPVGTDVRVKLHYDAKYKIPATAEAVIVNQALVSDRYIQLTPVYTGGGVLADGASLSVDRTQVPVEVDEVSSTLSDLSQALGPEGANSGGALSRLLHVGAGNLDGNGDELNSTIQDSAKVLSTLSDDSGDITDTIKNLQAVTQTLATNDGTTKDFIDNLAAVSSQLSGERGELTQALEVLGPTLQNVTKFVKDNEGKLSKDVLDLAKVTAVLVKQKDALGTFLTNGALGVDNLSKAYDPISGTLGTRADLQQLQNPAMWLCSLAYSLGAPPKQCEALLAPLNSLTKGLNLSLDLSWITALTTTYEPVCPPADAYPKNYKGPKPPKGCVVDPSALKPATNDKTKTLGGLLPEGTP